MGTRIVGTGIGLPKTVVSNEALAARLNVSSEWIEQRTGIRQRYLLSENESLLEIAYSAAGSAMSNAGISPDSLDAILVGTVSSDLSFPSFACQLQSALKASGAVAFDIAAACSGFIYSLSVAENFLQTGTWKSALIVGVDALSTMVSWDDPATAAVFGDGAGAAVLVNDKSRGGILKSTMGSDGGLGELVRARSRGIRTTFDSCRRRRCEEAIVMRGPELFKMATKQMVKVALDVLERAGISLNDVSLFIPHQANARIIAAVCERLGVTQEKVFVNIDRYGNTSAASIPIALHEALEGGRIEKGDLVLLDAFGGGLTWGACLFEW